MANFQIIFKILYFFGTKDIGYKCSRNYLKISFQRQSHRSSLRAGEIIFFNICKSIELIIP